MTGTNGVSISYGGSLVGVLDSRYFNSEDYKQITKKLIEEIEHYGKTGDYINSDITKNETAQKVVIGYRTAMFKL